MNRDAAAPAARAKLLPHEYVFGFFLLFTWARVAWQAGPFTAPALAFLGLLVTPMIVIPWAARRPSPARWRVRLLLYAPLMGAAFAALPSALALLELPSADPRVVAWEHAVFGEEVFPAIHAWEHPVLTDVMMVAYLFFFYYLVAGPAHYCLHDLYRFRQCFVGLFTVYGIGFIGYVLLPTAGPHLFLEFAEPLASGWITDFAKPAVDAASNGVDAFPSIHTAVSLYLLAFDARYHRRRFWWVLGPCIGLWVSTVYLRYHYGVDVLAGVALTAVGLGVAAAHERFMLRASEEPAFDAFETKREARFA